MCYKVKGFEKTIAFSYQFALSWIPGVLCDRYPLSEMGFTLSPLVCSTIQAGKVLPVRLGPPELFFVCYIFPRMLQGPKGSDSNQSHKPQNLPLVIFRQISGLFF